MGFVNPLARAVYGNQLKPEEFSRAEAEQSAFDDQVVAGLQAWQLPEAAILRLTSSLTGSESPATPAPETDDTSEKTIRPATRRSILFAVAVGLVLTACMLAFIVHEQSSSFTGADRLTDLLDSADTLTGDEFEPVEASARNLGDYFFLKHGLDRFSVPDEFGAIKTIGCRVFKYDNSEVAQIMAVGEKELLFYLFNVSDLGVNLKHGKWTVVDGENWVGGVTANNQVGFMVAFRGKHPEMQAYLKKMVR